MAGELPFNAVHEGNRDGLVYFRGGGKVEYINRTGMEFFGTDESLVGQNILEMAEDGFPEFDVELLYPSDHVDRARRAFQEGVTTRSQLVLIDDDQRRELEVIFGPVEQDGEIVGVVGSYRDISRRPNIHEQLSSEASQLEDQRRFLASIIDVLDDGIIVCNGDMNIELVNSAAHSMLGSQRPAEGLDLEAYLESTPVDSPYRCLEQIRQTRQQGQSKTALHMVTSEERDPRRLEVTTSTLGSTQDRVICKLTDTTERLEIQQMDLLGRIAQFSTGETTQGELGEAIIDAIVREMDVDFALLMEAEDRHLRPLAWRGIMLDEDVSLPIDARDDLAGCIDGGEPRRFDGWLWDETSVTGTVEQIVIPLTASGTHLGTLHLGYLRPEPSSGPTRTALDEVDVAFTEALGNYIAASIQNVRLLEQTESEQKRLSGIIETLSDGIFLYNRRGDILLHNSSAVRITGFSEWSSFNTDSPPYRVLDRDGNVLSRSELPTFEAVRAEEMTSREVVFDFETHRRDVHFSAAPVDTEAEDPVFVATLRDITDERQTDRRKDEFLSVASHELRSPLTPLTGLIQLARRQRENDQPVDLTLLTRAERQLTRLTRLIDGLLDLTRIETGHIELERQTVDMRQLVEDAVQPWQMAPGDVALYTELPEESVEVQVDPDRVHQVLTNIVDNAIKYSEPEGEVTIELESRDGEAHLKIEDDGVGMDEETIERVFDRFFHGATSDDAGPRSMGLGLYICRQIVEQHGGRIDVESAEGVGTRINIALPDTPGEPS
jgi:PAS domain S-box-containing protein